MNFVGYEVVANGVTLEWTPSMQAAELAYKGVRGSAQMYKHIGMKLKP